LSPVFRPLRSDKIIIIQFRQFVLRSKRLCRANTGNDFLSYASGCSILFHADGGVFGDQDSSNTKDSEKGRDETRKDESQFPLFYKGNDKSREEACKALAYDGNL
jgi:hypothetical protein